MRGTTQNSLYVAGQHFRRVIRIMGGIDKRKTGDPKRPDAREIGQIAKLYAHLKEGTARLDRFFSEGDNADIPEDTIDMLFEANGKIKITMTYITEIFMMRLAIDDLPPGILRRYESYASDKENIGHVECHVYCAISLIDQILRIVSNSNK